MAATVPVLNDVQDIIPAGGSGDLGFASGVNPWTFGDSVVLTDALDTDSVLMGISAVSFSPYPTQLSPNHGVQISVGVNAGDGYEEVAAFRTRIAHLVNTVAGSGINFLPCIYGIDALPAGASLEFRLCKESLTADGWYVRAAIIRKPLAGRLAMAPRQFCLPNGAPDFTLATPAVAETWSSWQTVRAASGNAMYVNHVNVGQTVSNQMIQYDFALGPEGDEEANIIHQDFHTGGRMTDLIGGGHPRYVPFYVPAATRLSWRVRDMNSGGLARTVYMSLTYVESYLDWFEQP